MSVSVSVPLGEKREEMSVSVSVPLRERREKR